MSKETVNDLDKPFNFQLRNLNPREARGLPKVTWTEWRVARRPSPSPATTPAAWVKHTIAPKLTTSFGKYKVYTDLCVYFYACFMFIQPKKEDMH